MAFVITCKNAVAGRRFTTGCKSRLRKAAIMTTKRSTLILTLLAASAVAQQAPPYPMSAVVTGLTWADATTIVHQATGL